MESPLVMKKPAAKRVCIRPFSKCTDAIEHKCSCVSEAILFGAPDLTQAARDMLISTIPKSLGVLKDQRHASQEMVVGLIEGVLRGIESEMQYSITQAKMHISQDSERRALCDNAVATAQAALETSQYALMRSKRDLANDAHTLQMAVNAREDAQCAICKSEVEHAGISQKKRRLEVLMSRRFFPLKLGSVGREAEKKRLIASLASMTDTFEMDSSLMRALTQALQAPVLERSSFDLVAVQQFEEEVAKRINRFCESLELLLKAKEGHEAAALTSRAVCDEAQQKCTASEDNVAICNVLDRKSVV